MSKSWKIQAITACALLVVMFATAAARCVWVHVAYMPHAQAEEQQDEPFRVYWATAAQSAPIFEGPGLRYPMIGKMLAGEAVEALCVQDGWAQVWHYRHLHKPVWVWGEYLGIVE